jgi:hypothetical protein
MDMLITVSELRQLGLSSLELKLLTDFRENKATPLLL